MKITEYPIATEIASADVTLIDGTNGTRKVQGSALPYAVNDLAGVDGSNHAIHRKIFRGKNLGATVTTGQLAAIQNGTFKDIWLGDYWEIGGVKYRVADFDYWYNKGDTKFTNHHVAIVPDTSLGTAKMNASSSTTGGYSGSAMRSTNMATAKSTITSAFNTAVQTYRDYLITTVTSGYPSAGAYTDVSIELMNEIMVYGCYIYTPANNGTTDVKRYTINTSQLALFAYDPTFITSGNGYWLRDVASSTHFARVDANGGATSTGAVNEFGIRPVFAIG